MRKELIPSEHDEQVRLLEWSEWMARTKSSDYALLFAIPNGGQRNKVTAAKLKAEGVKPGVPDLFLPVPKGIYTGLFIEMKRRKGGRVSPDQVKWLAELMSRGYKCIVARGCDQAIEAITYYMEGDGFRDKD